MTMNSATTLLGLLLLAPLSVLANCSNDKPLPLSKGTFSIAFENDLFAGSDGQYTNGIQLGWVSGDLSDYRDDTRLPQWSEWFINRLPFINECGLQRSVGISLGQKIFTPDDISRRELIVDDRPYAGWLYGGIAFHNKNLHRLDTLEIQAGLVGPTALAEQAQNLVHELRGIDKAEGWENQLNNEFGLMFIYEHRDRFQYQSHSPWGADLITHYGATLGNVYTYVNAGAELRFGWRLPADFGTSTIRPGGEGNAPVDSNDPGLASRRLFGVHFFIGVSGRGVLRDLFLDGNTFSDSHDIDKYYWVGDLSAGVAMTWQGFKLSYRQVHRTREFRGQPDGHNFGSLSLSYSF